MSQITLLQDDTTGFIQLQSNGNRPATLLCSMCNDNSNLYDVSLTGASPAIGDGVVACDLPPIRAHKVVLAHASPHLFDLFTVQGYIDSNKSKYVLENIDHNSLRNIVKFIYTDKVDLTDDNAAERVRGVLIGAKYLIMRDLAEACETFLAGNDQIDVQNCIDVFQFALKYKCGNLLSAVCAFIAKNLLDVSQSAKFLGLAQDECAKFLLSEPVVAANADDRCRAAIAWLNHESPSRAESAKCIMSMAALDAAGVKPETLLLASQSAVIRPTIKGFALTLIDALASNVHCMSQLETEQQNQTLKEAQLGEAWYVIGGSQKNGNTFYRFDVTRREWSSLPVLPWDRKYAGACAVGKRLIVMGGRKRGRLTVAIDEYDTTTQIWSVSKAKLSSAKEHVSVVTDTECAYAFGGRDYSITYDLTERYCMTPKKGLVRLAVGRMDDRRFQAASACKDNVGMFVVGGLLKDEDEDSDEIYCKTIDKYDFWADNWFKIATLKKSRRNLGCAFLGDDLYIVGGCESTKVEIVNTDTGHIRLCGARLRHERMGCSAVSLDQHNVVCVVGGCYGNSCACVETYDSREGKWSTGVVVPDMPKCCSHFGFAHVRP